jgi:molybdopterin molybdotransferase
MAASFITGAPRRSDARPPREQCVQMDWPLITVKEAQARVLAATRPLPSEQVSVDDALDRVLAQDVRAAADVPTFPSSAMDGFAIKAGPAARTMTVVGESRAGRPAATALRDGEAIRISTGAAVPEGATSVIRQEDVADRGKAIETQADTAVGSNIRDAGEDMQAGTTVLFPGATLGAAELGVAAAAGVGTLIVARRPRVSILCTGDELRAPGTPLGPGEIHNSNAPMLAALARHCGARADPARRLADDFDATEAGLAQALEHSDVVIVTGGVSVGPHDHVKPALASLGVAKQFWGVSLQPGKPTWFGAQERKLVFGLPGNPVSAVVTFSLFARPALAALQGARHERPLDSEAVLGVAVPLSPAREQAVRVRLERSEGHTIAIPNGPQGSHIVTSLVGAQALALIPPGDGELGAGTRVALEHLAR